MSLPPSSDEPLLTAWVRRRDEEAFRALTEKYTALVFGAALRKTGCKDWAEEVTQEVFVIFARRAIGLNGDGGLAGWLHRTALLTAATRIRAESRRRQRLQKFAAISSPEDHAPAPGQVSDRDWNQILSWLDDALTALSELDRRVILEHYFERKTYAEVAALAGLTLEATRKRGLRALEKLHLSLRRRGAEFPVAVLGSGLAAAFRQSAPAALAVQSGAAGIAAVAGSATSGVTTILSLFAMKTILLPAAAVVLLTGLVIALLPKTTHQPVADAGESAAVRSPIYGMDRHSPTNASIAAKTIPISPQGNTAGRTFVPPVTAAPASPLEAPLMDSDPALKQAFYNHPKSKLAEKRFNALGKGFKSLWDRSRREITALSNQINESQKMVTDTSTSAAEQTAAKNRIEKLSALLHDRNESLEKFRIHAETWLQTEVGMQRSSILEEIKNSTDYLPQTLVESEGIALNSAHYTKLKEGHVMLGSEDYPAALEAYKSLAGETTGKMRDVALWNTMLCGMILQNQGEVDAASARLLREASPGAACFALAAQSIQRNEWADAQIWVNQARESGDTENHFFLESFARLGWMGAAGDSLLIPPPAKQ